MLLFGRLDIEQKWACEGGSVCDEARAAAIVPFELWEKALNTFKVMVTSLHRSTYSKGWFGEGWS